MDSEFVVRTAKISDIDSIMKVEKASFIESIQEEESVFLKRIEICPSLFLIFEQNGKVAGYLSAEILEKVPEKAEELKLGHEPKKIDPEENKAAFVYISSFAILPEYRGGGNGKKLWNESIKYFRTCGFHNFLLLVNEVWKGAAHIYEESGFSQIQIFKDFFPSTDEKQTDGILMQFAMT